MPLTSNDIRDRLADHREAQRNFKVRSLFVVGSVARGEANQGSDVDLLVEFSEPVGLFEFARLQRFLEDSLRARVDLVTRAALRESMREEVLREAVRAAQGWRLRVEDTLVAIARIKVYVGDISRDAFAEDQRTVDAVIRNLEIVGEAAGHVPEEVQEQHPSLPWSEMRAMRNLLSHAYFLVDLDIVWKTVCDDLPLIEPELRRILDEIPE